MSLVLIEYTPFACCALNFKSSGLTLMWVVKESNSLVVLIFLSIQYIASLVVNKKLSSMVCGHVG